MLTTRRSAAVNLFSSLFTSAFRSSSSSSCKRRFPSFFSIKPPVAKKIPYACAAHGRNWDDPYHWMSDTRDPDLVDYLRRENAYAEAFMADAEVLRRTLAGEMKSRMPATVSTPPEPWGPWLYYQYIPAGKEYPVLCRRMRVPDGFVQNVLYSMKGYKKEQVLLDWNVIAEQFGYVHIGACRISPDHKFLAYTLDTSANETFVLQVKDLQTGHIVPSSKVDRVVSLAWAGDNKCLLYTVCDETQRPYRVFCMELGSNDENSLIFTENDMSCCVDITSTKDGKFITINSNSRTSSEVYVMDTRKVKDGFWQFRKRVTGVQYFLEHHYGFFYILTNAPVKDMDSTVEGYYLARCNADKLRLSEWQVISLPGRDITFQDMDIFHGHLVLSIQQKGIPTFCAINIPIDDSYQAEDLDPFSSFDSSWDSARWRANRPQRCVSPSGMPPSPSASSTSWQSSYSSKASLPSQRGDPPAPAILIQFPVRIEELHPWFFPIPSDTCNIVPGSNHDFMSSTYRVVISSPVMPDVIVDYDLAKRTFTILHQEEVVGLNDKAEENSSPSEDFPNLTSIRARKDEMQYSNLNMSDFSHIYSCERKDVVSHDGFIVSLTIVYSREAHCVGKSPGLLHGYGAYGEVLDKSWSSDQLSLLSRSWVLAYADVRGGGGDGPVHHSGARTNKINSINDFVACSMFLISEGFVDKSKLCAVGCSAGGLLVAAAINSFPSLYSAAILKVPFLDVCNTLLDPSLPLTILDYDEFGDPRIESEFELISRYSPYDNIGESICYPSILVTASFCDSRVGVWEAAKWVARMRERTCPTCTLSVILKTNMTGGHFGEGGRYVHCDDTAFEYAFLLKAMGMLEDDKCALID